MAEVFDELNARRDVLAAGVAQAEVAEAAQVDPEAEVAAAMATARRLVDLAAEEDNLAAAGDLFRALNVRLFLRFRDDPRGKRTYRATAGGVVTFGDAPPPVPLYDGLTDRKSVSADVPVSPSNKNESFDGSEGLSVGNGGRGTPRPVAPDRRTVMVH